MIPKIIHYCWFGNGDIPARDLKCIESWRIYCPDYKIIIWNEKNYDITKNKYMYEAYKAGKFGFVPDYARLDIVYKYGGIYLDTDVELLKPLDALLDNEAFCGFENKDFVAFGLGFGAQPKNAILKELRDLYDTLEFKNVDGTLNLTPSPYYQTQCLLKFGLKRDGKTQEINGFKVFSIDYFNPKNYSTGEIKITENTYSIHHFHMSWKRPIERILIEFKYKINNESRFLKRIAFKMLYTFLRILNKLDKIVRK